jgi:hypothetical protein
MSGMSTTGGPGDGGDGGWATPFVPAA